MDNTKITNTFNTLFGKLSVTFRHLHQTCRITKEHIRIKTKMFLKKHKKIKIFYINDFLPFWDGTENFSCDFSKSEMQSIGYVKATNFQLATQ